MNRKRYIFLFVLSPLLLGFCIYLIFDRQIIVLQILGRIFGCTEKADIKIESGLLLFIRNYVCDFLWAFSLTQVTLLILGPQKNSVVLSLTISILFEVIIEGLQITVFFSGTFDPLDITIEVIATIIATIVFISNYYQA